MKRTLEEVYFECFLVNNKTRSCLIHTQMRSCIANNEQLSFRVSFQSTQRNERRQTLQLSADFFTPENKIFNRFLWPKKANSKIFFPFSLKIRYSQSTRIIRSSWFPFKHFFFNSFNFTSVLLLTGYEWKLFKNAKQAKQTIHFLQLLAWCLKKTIFGTKKAYFCLLQSSWIGCGDLKLCKLFQQFKAFNFFPSLFSNIK